MTKLLFIIISTILSIGFLSAKPSTPKIHGELRQWHKITIDFKGPETSEKANPSPFTSYRMDVTFKKGEDIFVVPGHYAADGNAANSGADSGSVWRVHFSPHAVGDWAYSVKFIKGSNVIYTGKGESAGYFDGVKGRFKVEKTNKTGKDLRAKGRLSYVGGHHLRFEGSGEYFLKCGSDAPENFFAYSEFDGDFKTDGEKDQFIKNWAPHIRDWRRGDPTWQKGKGKGIIGAVNYLADQGMNNFSFLTFNIAGDDRNVFPYPSYGERERMDCSKLDQWEIVLEHGTRLGMHLHFKTQEAENTLVLDKGEMGLHRTLYYRELIARFGHHLALNWNVGEEVGHKIKVDTKKKKDWIKFFHDNDPYHHPIVIHNGDNHFELMGAAESGGSYLTGFSLQTHRRDFSTVHRKTLEYINKSVVAGKPWVVACDEPGDASYALVPDDKDPSRDKPRKNALWGNIMAGGAGVEWYFGYKNAHSDLTCQDFRSRQKMWDQCRYALDFFSKHTIPFWDMINANKLISTKKDYCLAKAGVVYLVYLKDCSKPTSLNLEGEKSGFVVTWYNPREGGVLQKGSVKNVKGGGKVSLGNPPSDQGKDWLVMVRAAS